MNLNCFGLTDVGKMRKHNEDSILVDAETQFFMVADGVGGSRAGDVASRMATEIVYQAMARVVEDLQRERANEAASRDRLMSGLQSAILRATEAIYNRGQTNVECRGMSTTTVALQILGSIGFIGHVGDSRLYMIRNGVIYQLTEDHTLVQLLLSRGALRPEQAETFANRNVITRSVGREPTVEVDVLTIDVIANDIFLLCSDGLTDLVSSNEIRQIALSNKPKEAAESLVAKANDGGGRDNISVVIVKVEGEMPAAVRMPTEQKVGLLREVFLFKELSFAETIRVLSVVREMRVPDGHRLITEGEFGDVLFVLMEGEVDVTKKGVFLTRINCGGHFGELGLLGGVRTATVTANGNAVLLRIGRDDLFQLIRNDHNLAIKLLWGFLKNVGERMRSLSSEVAKLRDPRAR